MKFVETGSHWFLDLYRQGQVSRICQISVIFDENWASFDFLKSGQFHQKTVRIQPIFEPTNS
jgi:hypothetical protein